MKSALTVTLLLLLTAILVGAGSYYATDVRQEGALTRMKESRRVAELQNALAEDLLVREAASSELAGEALTKWRSRYKYIPTTLNTADMVEYLESLTRSGFEQFDLFLASQTQQQDFSTYQFKVSGTAYYKDFYHLVWHLENNREFYRIYNLKANHVNVFKKNRATDVDRRLDMVAFQFDLDAYYAGIDGISAPQDSLRPVPLALLQAHAPPDQSFTPLVRTDLPPNADQLLDVENAKLISIIGNQAIFEDQYGRHVMLEGDRIYLGSIVLIDPINSFVRVTLNKGDRTETVNIRLGTDEPYRQALGDDVQVQPIDRGQGQ